jgi:predicted enzyme related to lactoylglutathione lyase
LLRWTWAFIDRPTDRFDQAAAFWTTVTATRLSARRGADGEFATLLPSQGDAYLKLQGVHDSGGSHLDLDVDDVDAAESKVRDLGGSLVARHADWTVMQSPTGQPFCLTPTGDATARPPVVVARDGTTSRLDQVCVDVAPSSYAAEVAFWTEVTGWEQRRGALPEFTLLKPPRTMPFRMLLQRLDSERTTSAHLDVACSDVEATRMWHERHGARVVARRTSWIVMEDPTGGTYCLTGRDPQTGNLR